MKCFRDLSLKTSGKNEELRVRLRAALEISNEESDDKDVNDGRGDGDSHETNNNSDVVESFSEEETTSNVSWMMNRERGVRSQLTLTFWDVEDSLETFSGGEVRIL